MDEKIEEFILENSARLISRRILEVEMELCLEQIQKANLTSEFYKFVNDNGYFLCTETCTEFAKLHPDIFVCPPEQHQQKPMMAFLK